MATDFLLMPPGERQGGGIHPTTTTSNNINNINNIERWHERKKIINKKHRM